MRPIASYQARRISLTYEDREDAESIILAHLAESAQPPQLRRISDRTGKTVAGYPGTCLAFPWFCRAAKNKAQDIIKSRCRQWRREGEVMQGLIDSGEFLTQPEADLESA